MSGKELRFGRSGSGRRKIRSLLSLAGFALALSLPGPAAEAAPPESSGIAVEYIPPILTLRVTQSMELRTVLQTLCYHTEAECIITPYASEIMVAPTTLTGTWDEVAAKLAGSFNLNYAAAAPTPGRPGMLAVLGSAASSGQEVMVKSYRNIPESVPAGPRSPADLTPASLDLTEGKSQQRANREPSKGSSDSSPSLPEAFGGGPVGGEQVSNLSGGEATPNPEQLQASERSFRTMYGVGLLTNQLGPPPRTVVLPFSGPNGNPITVSVINEPVTVLPWPGPDGLPIIVSPGTPGLKLDPPIPPSVPTL